MAGNLLGNKSKYVYSSDVGTDYLITRDDDLATAGGLTIAIGTALSTPSAPKGFTPRGVWVQATTAVNGRYPRKFIICSTAVPLWAAGAPSQVDIDGVNFTSTGRVGEKARYI